MGVDLVLGLSIGMKIYDYSTFSEFKVAIDNSLNKIITGQAQEDLNSLLNLKFQLFK